MYLQSEISTNTSKSVFLKKYTCLSNKSKNKTKYWNEKLHIILCYFIYYSSNLVKLSVLLTH